MTVLKWRREVLLGEELEDGKQEFVLLGAVPKGHKNVGLKVCTLPPPNGSAHHLRATSPPGAQYGQ
jgi:hypothetical protein